MDKKILAVVAIGLLVFFTGCTGMDNIGEWETLSAGQIRDKSLGAMQNINSYAFDMDIDMTTTGGEDPMMLGTEKMSMGISGKGKTDLKNKKMYMDMSVNLFGMTVSMESYIIDDMQYMKIPMYGWVKNKTSTGTWDAQDYAKFQSDLMKGVEVKKLEDEQVDGKDCYVLSMKPDVKKLFELMSQMGTGGTSDMDPEELEGIKSMELKQWIAKDNHFIMKTEMKMQMEQEGATVDMDMTMKLYDYNKPMNIVLPKEAENAIDMDDMESQGTGSLGGI